MTVSQRRPTLAGTELGKRLAGSRLTPVQRRIARHVLDSPREAALSSSVDLANAIGVSQPSMTRFANAVGFGGYADLVRALRETLFEEPPVPLGGRDGEDRATDAWSSVIDRTVDDLQRLHGWLGETNAAEVASRAMMASVPLLVYGCRLSLGVTEVFSQLAAKIHPMVLHLDGRGARVAEQIAQAAEAGARCMLAVVLPRYPREAARAMETARRAGLTVVLLTDSPLAAVVPLADQVLLAPVNSSLVFDTLSAPMQLVSILLELMVEADPERAEQRLEAFDQVASDEGVFLADK